MVIAVNVLVDCYERATLCQCGLVSGIKCSVLIMRTIYIMF